MKKRKISSLGQPLLAPNGRILHGVRISFVLVDPVSDIPIDVFNALTGERISGRVDVVTDEHGEFEVELFPNNLGDKVSNYMVIVDIGKFENFKGALLDSNEPISFFDFRNLSEPVTPAQINSIENYINDMIALIEIPQGDIGPQGIQGVKGDKGDQGDIGLTGPQGIQGVKGDTGSQGVQGNVGPQGIQGDQGPQGVKGDTGLTGDQGIQGVKGDTGLTGSQGIQGIQGPQGIQGDIGLTGPQGVKGDTGLTGSQGIQGDIGLTGPQGIQGDTGLTGANGIYTVITDATTSRILQLTDASSVINFTAATAVTVTVPPNVDVAFPTNTEIAIVQYGTGKVTVAKGSGVTVNSKSAELSISDQFSSAVLKKIATDEWLLIGSLTT